MRVLKTLKAKVMNRKLKIALLGKSARLDAMLEALVSSDHAPDVFVLSDDVNNISLSSKANVTLGRSDDEQTVLRFATSISPDFAVIGPEEPLAAGIVDALQRLGIRSVGPIKELAKIESSKAFARKLIEEKGIDANPEYREFHGTTGLLPFMRALGDYVIKPDGLTGGKGVKVMGDHFETHAEGLAYCNEIFESGGHVLIEEKLDGEEFTFQTFCDGNSTADTIAIQDHKRLLVGDKGPNTGGMGSYSCPNHLLPFLTQKDLDRASSINRQVADALRSKEGEGYKGILYGGFIKTKRGLRVIEYNARFGDPEAMNVLPLLNNDFVDVCRSIVDGTLHQMRITFAAKATVCKYAVPKDYPRAKAGGKIDLSAVVPNRDLRVYYGAVSGTDKANLTLCGSRAIAFVGIGETLAAAEAIAERAASSAHGDIYHREDIGTNKLVQKRVSHMSRILRNRTVKTPRTEQHV